MTSLTHGYRGYVTEKASIVAQVESELKREAVDCAHQNEMTVSDLVRTALRSYLDVPRNLRALLAEFAESRRDYEYLNCGGKARGTKEEARYFAAHSDLLDACDALADLPAWSIEESMRRCGNAG